MLELAMNVDLVSRLESGLLSIASFCDDFRGVGKAVLLPLSGLGDVLNVTAAARALMASGCAALAGSDAGSGLKVRVVWRLDSRVFLAILDTKWLCKIAMKLS